MTVCRQFNYIRKNSVCGDFSEELVADGEVYGRNWSLVERVWKRDAKWHRGKFHYQLRIDISEYNESYHKLIYSEHVKFDDICAMTIAKPRGCDVLHFSICNQSPGIWENGFNPNYWLSSEIGSYKDDEERLLKIVETGRDLRDVKDIGLVVQDVLDETRPFFDLLENTAPPGTPYHYWWGIEKPPPPRKPVY